MFRHVLSIFLGVIFISMASTESAAIIYEIDSGTTQVDTIVDPLSSAESVSSFYDYDPTGFSQLDFLVHDTMHVFLYEDTTESGEAAIGLVIIFDDPASGNLLGGNATVDLSGAPVTATIEQQDDSPIADVDDSYPASGVNGQYIWDWSACCTDGVAIGNIGNQEWVIEISIPDIIGTDTDLRRITDFAFLTGDPANPTFLTLESLQSTSLFITARLETTSIPEPSTIGLFAVGLAVFGVIMWRRRQQSEGA